MAACGVILPSFITITVIAAFFTRFQDNPIVKAAFMGIRSTVVALILMAAIKVGKKAIKDKFSVLITIMTVILVLVLDIHAIFAIVIGAIGLVIYFTSPKARKSLVKETRQIDIS